VIVSLFIILFLCFKGILLVVNILLTVSNWSSWSDRPLIRGDVEGVCSLLLPTNILSMAVIDLFRILVAKFTVCDKLYVINNEASFFGCFQ
jgi:hypothetical protein